VQRVSIDRAIDREYAKLGQAPQTLAEAWR
jgi:hypothetical protein